MLFFSLLKPAGSNIQNAFPAPVRFIKVESVFFDLPVIRNKALIVPAGNTALVTAVYRKIKHIPNERAPKFIRFLRHKIPQRMLMNNGLPFL